MSQSRQLAAIMFTDIVGYTALMGNDEEKAFRILNKNRGLQKPIIEQFNGRWIKELGDGVMASFNTVSEAVNAAIKIQKVCNTTNEFQLRIGIHQGEVVFENDDVFGDGVNIAARIQTAANPGCIFISESVNNNIRNRKDIKTHFVNEEKLKNVAQPTRLYQVLIEGSEMIMPEKPVTPVTENSIAVLPFVNMSNDQEQEYFCDGLSEEILNVLAQLKELKVSARTSSFSFRGKDVDIVEIGNKLKVDNVLEGSVRKSGDKLRVTAQLIKVSDGFHLWSKRYDRQMADIFDIQDEISKSILDALKITLLGNEETGLGQVRTEKQEAYLLTLQGMYHLNKMSPEGWLKSLEYFDQAIKVDPRYAAPYGGKSHSYYWLLLLNIISPENWSQALENLQACLTLDKNNADGLLVKGLFKFWHEWKYSEGEIILKKAIDSNPNDAVCLSAYAQLLTFCGRNKEAETCANKAIQLDPLSSLIRFTSGWTFFLTGNFARMYEQGLKIMELDSGSSLGYGLVAYHSWLNSDFEEAIRILESVPVKNVPLIYAWLGCLYGITGQNKKALDVIDKLKELGNQQFVGAYNTGLIYLGLGKHDEAFRWFNIGIEQHDGILIYLKQKFKVLPGLKKDFRMDEIITKLGLPE